MKKLFKIKVIPLSSQNEIVGEMGDGTLKIKLAAPPVEGKANEALLKFLAKEWDVSQTQIRIVKGQRSKNKVILIDDAV